MSADPSTPPSDRSETDGRPDVTPGANAVAPSAPGLVEPRIGRYGARSLAELKVPTQGSVDWLWDGYLAPRNLTLLTSLWKAGKSTLVSVLLARMKTGGTLAGRAMRAGRAVVISEEPAEKWVERSRCVDLDGHVDWWCLPFVGPPTEAAWLELLAGVERLHERTPLALLVIDSLANLAPLRSENDAVQMLRPLQPLRRLTERGIAVLIAHHPRKGRTRPGQAARGSGALAAFVDIIVEMRALSRRPADRRRLLRAFSRHAATPPRLVIEWTADGLDYRSLGTSAELDYEHGWPVMQAVLEQSEGPLTRLDILSRWPDAALAPSKVALWKWLGRAAQEGRVLCEGRGTRREPFRYQLPGMAEKWYQNFLASFQKELAQDGHGKGPTGLEAPRSGDDAGTGTVPPAPAEEATRCLDPVPPPEPRPPTATRELPPADLLPSPTADPVEPPPEASVRLPYPYNMMNPADVPEEVWRRAWEACQNEGAQTAGCDP